MFFFKIYVDPPFVAMKLGKSSWSPGSAGCPRRKVPHHMVKRGETTSRQSQNGINQIDN